MPSITPPDHHLIPIQRPLPQAHMVSDHKGSRDSGKGDRHTKKQWFTPSRGFCKRLESRPPVTGHPWFQLRPLWRRAQSQPRSFAGADTTLMAAVANTASSSPGCYGQHVVQVPR